jgi:hypothetical protein
MSKYLNVASIMFIAGGSCETRGERGRRRTKKAAFDQTRQALESLRGYGLDLAVLCESVESSGQDLADAEELRAPGRFLSLYLDYAARQKCHLAGSVKLREKGRVYNSIAFVSPGGILGAYHKTHLTPTELDMGLSPGLGAVVVDSAIGRLGGVICFDLNFETLRRQYAALKPDILCFASNYHGGLMQGQWAYQCRAFFVSALYFHGGGILDPFGRPRALSDCYTAHPRARINLDRAMVHLDYNRDKFPAIEKKYLGEVVIDVPPNIGPALVYSLTPKRTALDVVREFGLELIDDYFARCETANAAARRAGGRRRR